eukprot:1164972-Rhodomonas_salina.1
MTCRGLGAGDPDLQAAEQGGGRQEDAPPPQARQGQGHALTRMRLAFTPDATKREASKRRTTEHESVSEAKCNQRRVKVTGGVGGRQERRRRS